MTRVIKYHISVVTVIGKQVTIYRTKNGQNLIIFFIDDI